MPTTIHRVIKETSGQTQKSFEKLVHDVSNPSRTLDRVSKQSQVALQESSNVFRGTPE